MLTNTFENEINITDVATEINQVFVEVSKEDTAEIFKRLGFTPTDETGEDNDDYESGDLQFIFNDDGTDITEILLFPVYADYDDNGEILSLTNGEDFIDAPNEIWEDADLINAVKQALADKLPQTKTA